MQPDQVHNLLDYFSFKLRCPNDLRVVPPASEIERPANLEDREVAEQLCSAIEDLSAEYVARLQAMNQRKPLSTRNRALESVIGGVSNGKTIASLKNKCDPSFRLLFAEMHIERRSVKELDNLLEVTSKMRSEKLARSELRNALVTTLFKLHDLICKYYGLNKTREDLLDFLAKALAPIKEVIDLEGPINSEILRKGRIIRNYSEVQKCLSKNALLDAINDLVDPI